LAYFNIEGLGGQGKQEYLTQLPVTYAALFIPVAFAAHYILPPTQMMMQYNYGQ
jgi:hypothetical protein